MCYNWIERWWLCIAKSKKKSGRKNKYETHVKPRFNDIKAWCLDGLSEKQIAINLKIAYSSFNKYKLEYEEFSEVLKNTKEVADREVENAVYKTALGHVTQLKKAFKVRQPLKDKNDELIYDKMGRLIMVDVIIEAIDEVYTPPNVGAQAFWLKNRQKEKWMDKPFNRYDEEKIKLDREKFEFEKKTKTNDKVNQESALESLIKSLDKAVK